MHDDEDWLDSDDEVLSDEETSVQLGLPDGPIKSSSDIFDAAVSRIGGHPAFIAQEPPLDCARCSNCSNMMELLVQVWCPLEESPNDRALYVWGCARSACQKKVGSIRVWRGLRFNEKFAAKLEEKQARQKQTEAAKAKSTAEEESRRAIAKVNPFSMKAATTANANPFRLGAQIFGDPAPGSEPATVNHSEAQESEGTQLPSSDTDEEGSDEELLTAMASTTLEDSDWGKIPAYPPLYLSTVAEYLPPAPKARKAAEESIPDEDERRSKDLGWGLEGYENSMNLDQVFDRFTRRVGYQGEQCIRYELGGTPVPYAGDKVFDQLFPTPPSPPLPVTKPAFMIVPLGAKRTYDPSSIPACPVCKSRRVFECQLMPNLINTLETLGSGSKKSQTDEERRKEVQQVLKGSGGSDGRGMQWGTCIVFSCEKDCCIDAGSAAKMCWREEVVLVQWDT